MNNETTYTISGKNSDPGVWGFAFAEKVEAENFASMVTRLSFEAYKLTGNLVGFTGCEGLIMYMFETTEGVRGMDKHKLIAAFCAGKMTMSPEDFGGKVSTPTDVVTTFRNSIRRALDVATSENGYTRLFDAHPAEVADDIVEFDADLEAFSDVPHLLVPYIKEWQEDHKQQKIDQDNEDGTLKYINERSPI